MTQPIQEPGQFTRTDAKLTWGSNQLFRRPSPVAGGGTLPCAWMYEATDEPVTSGTGGQEVPGPNWDPGAGGDPGPANDAWYASDPDIIDVFVSAGFNGNFQVKETGIYLVQSQARWSNSFTAAKQLEIRTNNSDVPQLGFVWQGSPNTGQQVTNSRLMYSIEIYTFVTIQGSADTVYVVPAQQSGSTEDLDLSWSVIVQLAPIPVVNFPS